MSDDLGPLFTEDDCKGYTQGLPKRVVGRVQCDAMDKNGDRCDEPALFETQYHGDPELEVEAVWVVTRLCGYHGSFTHLEWEGNLTGKRWRELHGKGEIRFRNTDDDIMSE